MKDIESEDRQLISSSSGPRPPSPTNKGNVVVAPGLSLHMGVLVPSPP